jgi:hypothetical protein
MNRCAICRREPWDGDLKRCDDCGAAVCSECRADHPHFDTPVTVCETCYEKPRREKWQRKK